MGLSTSNLITADANRKLAELTATGQVDYNYAYNPTDTRGSDRHVLMFRDTPDDPAPARLNLSTTQFQLLLTGTEPWVYRSERARRLIKGDVTQAWTVLFDPTMSLNGDVHVQVELHGGFGEETIIYRDPDTLVSVWVDSARAVSELRS